MTARQSSQPRHTEAFLGVAKVPQVNAEVIGREEQLVVRVDGYRVNVVGVRVGIVPPRGGRVYSVFIV
jgi:hypothetical protein